MIIYHSPEQLNYLDAQSHLDALKDELEKMYINEIPGYAEGVGHEDELSPEEVTRTCAAMDVIDKRHNLRAACDAVDVAREDLLTWGQEQLEKAAMLLNTPSQEVERIRVIFVHPEYLSFEAQMSLIQSILKLPAA